MSDQSALSELPVAYAVALRLRRAGQTEEAVAHALGIEPAAAGPLLAIAESKLAELSNSSTHHATEPEKGTS